MNKKALRQLIAEDELETAAKQIIRYTEDLGEHNWHNQALSLAAQYESYEKDVRMGNVAQDDLRVARNSLIANYLGLIQDLPSQAAAAVKPKGIREERLKIWVFFSLFLGKLTLLLWINFQWQTGGLETSEALTTAGFLIPIFVAYISAIITETIRNRYIARNGDGQYDFGSKRVRSFLVWITFTIIPIYIIAFWMIISARAQGNLSPESMTNMLTLTESALGAYVGLIVFEMFKPKSD